MLRVAEHVERTDTGRQRRANEDAYFARSPLFAVADGMGGAQAGEVASQMAVDGARAGPPRRPGCGRAAPRGARPGGQHPIHALSQSDEGAAGMGTTLTAAYVDGERVALAHVGDSRAYRLRDGALELLSSDHSLVEELVRRGELTHEEADRHPQRSIITRALGPEDDVEVDHESWPAEAGDVYLLCSDGLTAMVAEARVAEIMREADSLPNAARALVDAANAAGGRGQHHRRPVPRRGGRAAPRADDQPTIIGAPAGDVVPAAAPDTAEPPRGRSPRPRRRGRGHPSAPRAEAPPPPETGLRRVLAVLISAPGGRPRADRARGEDRAAVDLLRRHQRPGARDRLPGACPTTSRAAGTSTRPIIRLGPHRAVAARRAAPRAARPHAALAATTRCRSCVSSNSGGSTN